jgi:hypothetical protein
MKTKLHKILSIGLFLIVPIFVMAQAVPREMVVMEIGTGTWCTYCPGAAMGADDLLENGCRVAVIENHNGDPFANVYSNARNSYYGISGYPTAAFDGVSAVVGGNHSTSMYPSYLPKYSARIAEQANIQLAINITHTGSDYTAVVTIDKVGSVTPADFKLHFFITVSNITYNWQGQSHLEHVTVKMVPDQNGTPVNFTSGNTQVVTLNYAMDPTWTIEDVEFIAFVQDATTSKEIFNGIKRAAIDLAADFTANATSVLKHESVTFTNGTTGGYIGTPETYSWLFPGGTPATSTDKDPVVVYSQVGTYDVTLIVDRGTQIDTLVKPGYITVNSPVGINPVASSSLRLSPNPCNGNFKIEVDGLYDLKVLDLMGHVVYAKSNISGMHEVGVALPAGSYFVQVQTGTKQLTQKLLVN